MLNDMQAIINWLWGNKDFMREYKNVLSGKYTHADSESFIAKYMRGYMDDVKKSSHMQGLSNALVEYAFVFIDFKALDVFLQQALVLGMK